MSEKELGMTGMIIKVLSKELQDDGETLLDVHVQKEVVDLSMVGIVEKGTKNGRTGIVFVFQRQGIPEYFIAPITERLFEGLFTAYTGAQKRFKENG